MNRLRVGLALTAIIGAIYAAAGIFDSLGHFALGAIIAASAAIGIGAVDYVENGRREELARYRAEVWHRRDIEALHRTQLRPGIYTQPRDGRHE